MYIMQSPGTPEITLAFLLTLISVFLMIVIYLSPLLHIFMAIGLSKMAKEEGYEKGYLAWIPFGNLFVLGKLVKKDIPIDVIRDYYEWILTLGSLLILVLTFKVPFIW